MTYKLTDLYSDALGYVTQFLSFNDIYLLYRSSKQIAKIIDDIKNTGNGLYDIYSVTRKSMLYTSNVLYVYECVKNNKIDIRRIVKDNHGTFIANIYAYACLNYCINILNRVEFCESLGININYLYDDSNDIISDMHNMHPYVIVPIKYRKYLYNQLRDCSIGDPIVVQDIFSYNIFTVNELDILGKFEYSSKDVLDVIILSSTICTQDDYEKNKRYMYNDDGSPIWYCSLRKLHKLISQYSKYIYNFVTDNMLIINHQRGYTPRLHYHNIEKLICESTNATRIANMVSPRNNTEFAIYALLKNDEYMCYGIMYESVIDELFKYDKYPDNVITTVLKKLCQYEEAVKILDDKERHVSERIRGLIMSVKSTL